MILYVSFGSNHAREISGQYFGVNNLAGIPCDNWQHGRDLAFAIFGDQFCTTYEEPKMEYFPDGVTMVSDDTSREAQLMLDKMEISNG